MTLFQLGALLFGAAGAFAGAGWGYTGYGLPGLVLGGIGGIFIGAGAGVLGTSLAMLLGIAPEVMRHRRLLRPHFGRYWSRARRADWEKAKATLPAGTAVNGRAVAGVHHGVYIDIGCGFPARLGRLWAKDGFDGVQPQVGDAVGASVRDFAPFERVIELTQAPQPAAANTLQLP